MKLKRTIKLTGLLVIFFTSTVYAAAAEEPKIISGTKTLLADASTWLTGIVSAVGGLWFAKNAMMSYISDDEALKAKYDRSMKRVAIGTILAVCGSGLISLILNYYQ